MKAEKFCWEENEFVWRKMQKTEGIFEFSRATWV